MVVLNELQDDPLLNDLLYTFCHHETILKLYGNGQGDQIILLAPSTGQNPSFIDGSQQCRQEMFLFYCIIVVSLGLGLLKHVAYVKINPQRSIIIIDNVNKIHTILRPQNILM